MKQDMLPILEKRNDAAAELDSALKEKSQEKIMSAQETLARIDVEIEKAKTDIASTYFDNVDVICMTIDGFNQVMSGGSFLSSLFESCEITVGILDEAHQCNADIVAAAACHIERLFMFYDPAQKNQEKHGRRNPA